MSDEARLRWSDAWLLLAIYYARNRVLACLAAIVAAADYIEHDVMNYEELASGMSRLKRAGLIKIAPDLSSVACLAKALAVIEPIVLRAKSAYEAQTAIEHEINATPWTPKEPLPHPANTLEYPGLTREMYAAAVDEYLRSMKSK